MNLPMAPTAGAAPAVFENIPALQAEVRALAEQRDAVILSALEEHSAADIARHAGVPEATVRTRLFHARKKLRAITADVAPITTRTNRLNDATRSRE